MRIKFFKTATSKEEGFMLIGFVTGHDEELGFYLMAAIANCSVKISSK